METQAVEIIETEIQLPETMSYNHSRLIHRLSLLLSVYEDQYDVLPELVAARDAIRAVPDPAKAAALEAKLGKFAFDQAEALKRLKAYQGTKEVPTPPLEKLKLLRGWTSDFKAEYEALRREAGR